MVGETVPARQRKNDLFNTLREHLTLNLCETVPDRNTTENRGTQRQKARLREKGGGGGEGHRERRVYTKKEERRGERRREGV